MHASDESVTLFHHSFLDALMYTWESQRIQKELELQLNSYFKSTMPIFFFLKRSKLCSNCFSLAPLSRKLQKRVW